MKRGVKVTNAARISRSDRAVLALLGVSGVCNLLIFIGWFPGFEALRGIGFDGYPVWPITAIGFVALTIALVARVLEQWRPMFAFLTVPVTIALLAAVQTAGGIDIGIDRLLFPAAIAQYEAAHPGRPGLLPIAVFSLVSAYAVLLAPLGGRDRRSDISTSILVSMLAATAIGMVLLAPKATPGGGTGATFLPIISASALVLAFLASQVFSGWKASAAGTFATLRITRVLLPAALLLPLLPSVLEGWLVHRGHLTPPNAEALTTAVNILILGSLAAWGAVLVERERAAAREFSDALNSTITVLTYDDGRIAHWSDGARKCFGWTAEEAVGAELYGLLRARCIWQWTPSRNDVHDGQELAEVTRDGLVVTILERVQRIENPGRRALLIHSMTDITERVAALAALRESEQRLAMATSAHELGVFEWDVASGRIEWSPGTEQRLGLKPGTISDFESWRALVEPEDVQQILDTIAQAVANRRERLTFRYRFAIPNGTVLAVEGSSRAFYDEQGNLLRTLGVMIDVTERDKRERALRANEAQLRSILESVPDPMVVITETGEIRAFSAAAEALWGYRAADVVGRNFTMLAPEADRVRYARALEDYLDNRAPRQFGRSVAGNIEAADGTYHPVEIRVGMAQTGSEALLTIFFRDVSERVAYEQRVGALNAELAHVSRQSAMSELAADLAHELNQPLSATSNFLAAARILMDRGDDPQRVDELLRMGSEQTQRAGEIIRRLRNFMARREVEMQVESLPQTIHDAVELVLVGTDPLDIRVTYALDPEAHLIFADRVQVQQVLVNLLRNSIQALRAVDRDQRAISITALRPNEQFVEIVVEDSGTGIPDTVLQRLGSRFISTKEAGEGMGIGLSISRRIIEAHGGALTAENRPGGGAIFRFTIPAAQEGERK